MSYNKAILVGNLTADPELKQTNSGKSVTTFTVAVQRQNKEQGADFITVVAWQKTAEFLCKYFTKGKPILVCGRIQVRTWQDQQGNKRYATEVVAEEVSFVGGKDVATAPAPTQQSGSAAPYGVSNKDVSFEEMTPEDDLPF